MDLKDLQRNIKVSCATMKTPFRSGTEIMLGLMEEIGEIATEVALLEQVGSKSEWEKKPNRERLAEGMTHAINLLVTLANNYDIDLNAVYDTGGTRA
jgi:hypothetical protein